MIGEELTLGDLCAVVAFFIVIAACIAGLRSNG